MAIESIQSIRKSFIEMTSGFTNVWNKIARNAHNYCTF